MVGSFIPMELGTFPTKYDRSYMSEQSGQYGGSITEPALHPLSSRDALVQRSYILFQAACKHRVSLKVQSAFDVRSIQQGTFRTSILEPRPGL